MITPETPTNFKPIPPTRGLTRVINAMGYSWHGLRAAFRDEAAFRQELVLVGIAIACMLILPIPLTQSWPLLASALGVLVVELLNSAVEAVVDLASPQLHPLAKKAKDTGSAAVALALVVMGMIWVDIFWDCIRK